MATIETDGGAAFVRIEPISDALVESAMNVLPEPWLADTDGQQLIQWVVYAFVEETDPAQPTATRVERDRSPHGSNGDERGDAPTALYDQSLSGPIGRSKRTAAGRPRNHPAPGGRGGELTSPQ